MLKHNLRFPDHDALTFPKSAMAAHGCILRQPATPTKVDQWLVQNNKRMMCRLFFLQCP